MNKKETAEEFVTQKLTGLTAKTLPDYPNSTFYVNDKDELILGIEKDIAWCRWTGFLSVLQGEYMLKYDEIQLLIGRILEQALKVNGVTVLSRGSLFALLLEQALKVNGVAAGYSGNEGTSGLEQTLKVKGVAAVEPSMKTTTGERGFAKAEFKDSVGHDCIIQEGSVDTINEGMGVWLGIPKPEITVFTDRGMANYVHIPTPENWDVGSLMYLSNKQIKQLIPMLQNFLKTGKIQ